MRIDALPSLGAHARAHSIRRDVAKVLSDMSTAHDRGSDISDHVAAVRSFCAAMIRECKDIKARRRGGPLVAEPMQLSLAIPLI